MSNIVELEQWVECQQTNEVGNSCDFADNIEGTVINGQFNWFCPDCNSTNIDTIVDEDDYDEDEDLFFDDIEEESYE